MPGRVEEPEFVGIPDSFRMSILLLRGRLQGRCRQVAEVHEGQTLSLIFCILSVMTWLPVVGMSTGLRVLTTITLPLPMVTINILGSLLTFTRLKFYPKI